MSDLVILHLHGATGHLAEASVPGLLIGSDYYGSCKPPQSGQDRLRRPRILRP